MCSFYLCFVRRKRCCRVVIEPRIFYCNLYSPELGWIRLFSFVVSLWWRDVGHLWGMVWGFACEHSHALDAMLSIFSWNFQHAPDAMLLTSSWRFQHALDAKLLMLRSPNPEFNMRRLLLHSNLIPLASCYVVKRRRTSSAVRLYMYTYTLYIRIYIYIYIYTYIHIYMYTYIHIHTYVHYITLHYITLHYTTLHYITLHYITIHACMHASIHPSIQTNIHYYITITYHYIPLHYIALHYITLHYITLHTYVYHTYPASPRSMLSFFFVCKSPTVLTQTTGHAKFATPEPSNCPCSPWSSLRWRSLAPPPPWAPWAAPAAPHAPRQCEPRSLRRWSWCSASVVKLGTFQRNPWWIVIIANI